MNISKILSLVCLCVICAYPYIHNKSEQSVEQHMGRINIHALFHIGYMCCTVCCNLSMSPGINCLRFSPENINQLSTSFQCQPSCCTATGSLTIITLRWAITDREISHLGCSDNKRWRWRSKPPHHSEWANRNRWEMVGKYDKFSPVINPICWLNFMSGWAEITSRHTINSNIFLMNEFNIVIIIMLDPLLVFLSSYFLQVWLFSGIS